eukprot:COSAG02_NODE_254_length_26937_cov_16.503950_7_plen_129_part_00
MRTWAAEFILSIADWRNAAIVSSHSVALGLVFRVRAARLPTAQVFGDNPDDPSGRGNIDAAVKRCYSGVGQISLTEFRRFCYDDEFVRLHCFGDTEVVDATAHLRNAAFAAGGNKWGGIAMAAQHQRH